jgi:cytochrome b subunit of formate dehydrogenase
MPLAAQEDAECLACHGDSGPLEEYADSLHGSIGVACVDCHQAAAGFDGIHADELEPADCSICHEDAQGDFAESVHGYAHERGHPMAPGCATCHGTHDIRAVDDPASRTHGVRLFAACAECHVGSGISEDGFVKRVQTAADFVESVHGRPDASGHSAASCIDCHGVHHLRGAADPESSIHRGNVDGTCGRCHAEIQREYAESIHGRALAAGVSDSPTCTDCHGEHLIRSTNGSGGITTAELAAQTCEDCHNDPRIIAKYDLDGNVVDSYEDSYHGWATSADSPRAANCVSCHTAHAVLPTTHPASTIHADNVVQTCATCHEGATAEFAESYTHASASITANPINRAIRTIYRVLIVAVIGAMILHNLVILNYFAQNRRRTVADNGWIRRLTPLEILQHMLLALSFIMLVITGFALRFPDAWWVGYLGSLGMTEPVRANLHRVFAVVLVAAALFHAAYLAFSRRGRVVFVDLIPRRRDISDLRDSMRFHTWRTDRPVRFPRFDYAQKVEYWAVLWGTVLMAITGVVLWLPELAVKLLPAWIVPASQTIHYYEAWLAMLAIIVWHGFFVIVHPDVYPMNWAWLNGKMSAEAAREQHADWDAQR